MAVLGPCVSVNMNGHNNIHNQLTKSLERIIEDAFLCGELKLSGRKLKEFPKPVNYDLSDTVIADLSKNRFSELPEEVTTYLYLERLFLSQNVIRSVPEGVGGLQSLTYLDLSSNQLTELPREICQMPLQVLLVSDNALTTLPKEIGRMGALAELDACHNRLTQVPMTLGDCGGLRALSLSNNQLGLLPLQITYLRLEHLDVSCNCISSLPLELRNMTGLVTLNLDHNPLVSPPTTVCMRGRVHIFKYLENMASKDLPAHRRVDETRRSGKHSSFTAPSSQPLGHQIVSGNATIDCLRHRPRPAADSGYSTDGVDKRWCNDAAGEAGGGGSGRSTPSTPSTLSPGTALSRAHSLSSETPLAPMLSGLRISPDGNMSNGDDKSKLAHQQTYRQYKEALRQQRQQDVYRSRSDQPSPDIDSSPQSQNQSPVHIPKSQSSPHSPIANGYSSNTSPNLYSRTLSSNSSICSISPNISHVPNSPLLQSTPHRFQSVQTQAISQNGNISDNKSDEIKRPVQKVVPSRNVNTKTYTGSLTNGNTDYVNGKVNGAQARQEGDAYIKPTSPTKSPTNTLSYNSIGSNRLRREVALNGGEPGAKLLTTTVSYLKGASAKPPGSGAKMSWKKDVAADKLSFTMKREFDKQKEELDLLEQLRKIIESRLKMRLPTELAPVLCDGVVLCHLANHVQPRSVASVHVPSPAQPKLTMARCRRNVDNFLAACRKIGVEEESICSAEDILCHHPEYGGPSRSPRALAGTLAALLTHATLPQRSSKDFNPPEPHHQPPNPNYQQNNYPPDAYNIDPNYFYACQENEVTSNTCQYNYYQCNQVFERRYSDDRIVSNCNVYTNDSSNYTIDEMEEYVNYENNNTEVLSQNAHYAPMYSSDEFVRNRNYNYLNNKIQFVTPFFKNGGGHLTGDNYEIYDTDEIDGPQAVLETERIEEQRYDRTKMNLSIENNLNNQLNEAKANTKEEEEKRFQITILCLGTFFMSFIILFLYPL